MPRRNRQYRNARLFPPAPGRYKAFSSSSAPWLDEAFRMRWVSADEAMSMPTQTRADAEAAGLGAGPGSARTGRLARRERRFIRPSSRSIEGSLT